MSLQPTEAPFNYLGLEPKLSSFNESTVFIWPVPYEKTVSYGRGTGQGPAAIIDASRYIETYDEELGGETSEIGIHTLEPIGVDYEPEEMVDRIQSRARELLRSGRFLCTLGGEHSITPPLVRAHHEVYPDLSVLQIDAHGDLRNSYEGSGCSHACAMRRVVEVCPAVQVGIRSISAEEVRALPGLPTRIFYAKDIAGKTDWIDAAVDRLTSHVYLTVDIDGLDPSLVPSTGTPEPGGLLWAEVLTLIRTLAAKRKVVGMDLVELCKSSASNAPSFLAAKLIYKSLGYIFRDRVPRLATP